MKIILLGEMKRPKQVSGERYRAAMPDAWINSQESTSHENSALSQWDNQWANCMTAVDPGGLSAVTLVLVQ